jgi:hypothetical protein
MKPSDIKKEAAQQLADILYQAADRGNLPGLAKELAAELGVRLLAPAEAGEAANVPEEKTISLPDGIGIWLRTEENGTAIYQRSMGKRMDWWLWAKQHQFPALPAAGRKRVVLLGESVARGYLYDPHYTVAQELEALLNGLGPSGSPTEVVDLARSDLSMPMLKALLSDSLQLSPDAIVVFAGNNWLYTMKDRVTAAEYRRLASLAAKGELEAVEATLTKKFSEIVTDFLSFAGAFTRRTKIPVVFIIPEFNLADWRSNPMEQIATRLKGNGMSEWVTLRARGEEALRDNDLGLLDAIALRMIQLDRTHPLGFEWKADAALHFEKPDEARELLERARDTAIFARAETKPRSFAVIRDTISRGAEGQGIHVVDLPAIFCKESGGVLPGKELFLDYCHLTVKGIKIAMRHTAAALSGFLFRKPVPVERFKDTGLVPDNDAISVAHIGAAVHNAHYGQSARILEYHCAEAIKAAEFAWTFMQKFVDFSSRRLSNTLCKTHEEVVESGVFTQYEGGLGFIHSRKRKLLDIPLVNTMVGLLSQRYKSIKEDILNLRLAQHKAKAHQRVDLLEPWYSKTSYDVFNAELPSLNYYQGRQRVSEFVFIAGEAGALSVSMTGRLPGSGAGLEKAVELRVNGQLVEMILLGDQWKTVGFVVDEAYLVPDGVQKLTITWPVPELSDEGLPRLLEPGDFLDFLYPVWGELFDLGLSIPAVIAREEPVGIANTAVGTTFYEKAL